jgi:Zn ribbon nucleic-acid-binding protein
MMRCPYCDYEHTEAVRNDNIAFRHCPSCGLSGPQEQGDHPADALHKANKAWGYLKCKEDEQ